MQAYPPDEAKLSLIIDSSLSLIITYMPQHEFTLVKSGEDFEASFRFC